MKWNNTSSMIKKRGRYNKKATNSLRVHRFFVYIHHTAVSSPYVAEQRHPLFVSSSAS
ncbi:hypothetical protein [Bacillus sp. REN10]|uniref:hypothetical protein n=1 Tax=Bacillus sp. REN10 TaxID=2782541 RepID=UPI00193B3EA6|nr:hypothetical protein [Bacillus sp. REN10]